MTSETFIFGGPVSEKVAIGMLVRQFAASRGPGHVLASVENYADRLVVCDAFACPLRDQEENIRRPLQAHLNAVWRQ